VLVALGAPCHRRIRALPGLFSPVEHVDVEAPGRLAHSAPPPRSRAKLIAIWGFAVVVAMIAALMAANVLQQVPT
jgi:hypothetical protein